MNVEVTRWCSIAASVAAASKRSWMTTGASGLERSQSESMGAGVGERRTDEVDVRFGHAPLGAEGLRSSLGVRGSSAGSTHTPFGLPVVPEV